MDVLLGTAGWTGITGADHEPGRHRLWPPLGRALEGPGLTEAWAHSALRLCCTHSWDIAYRLCTHSSSGGLGQTSGAAPNHPGSSEAGVSGKVPAHIPQLASSHWLPTSPLQQLHGYALTSPQMTRQ